MNEKDLKELYDKLIDFATLPCDVEEQCKGCEIGYYCSMLYYLHLFLILFYLILL